MNLKKINITNFKSIKDSKWIDLNTSENITVLAGQNESGKSAVLESIDFLFNGPSTDFARLQKRQDANITKVMGVVQLDKEDKEFVEGQLTNDKSKEILKALSEVILHRVSSDSNPNEFVIEAELKDGKELNDEIINVITNRLPIVSLYTSFRDLLPSEILISDIPNNPAVKDFSTVFEVDLQAFSAIEDPRKRKIEKTSIEKRAEDDFNSSWSQSIKSLKNQTKYKFSLEIIDTEPKKLLFMIEGQDGIPLYLEQKSMGFRWFSSFHLRLRAIKVQREKENAKDLILLIDEPGQNLHDSAQTDVKAIIEETAGHGTQIIYSTHNPRLIVDNDSNKLEFNRIRLVAKDEKNFETSIYTIPQFLSTRKGQVVIDTLAPIRAALGLSDVSQLLASSKRNVVVEGISDHYYLSSILSILGAKNSYYFIPSCGVDNVKHVVSLLIGWGNDYRAIFDDDAQQGRKAYNLLKETFYENNDTIAHKYIHKIKGKDGIEDLFSQIFFQENIIPKEIKLTADEKKMKNSELAEKYSKEMIARVFYEKSKQTKIELLDDDTRNAFTEIKTWLDTNY